MTGSRSLAVFPGGSPGEDNLPPTSPPSWSRARERTTLYLSLGHTEADVEPFLDAARATLREDSR